MIIDDSEDKKKIKFETVAINPSIDPNGGYWLRLKLAQPLAEKTVFNEVAETLPIKITPKTIAYILDATLTTTASRASWATCSSSIPRRAERSTSPAACSIPMPAAAWWPSAP